MEKTARVARDRNFARTSSSTIGERMNASSTLKLPSILGIGPGRTGTTWLHRVLEGHVDLPYGIKETLYFTTFYYKGLDWYARHFRYASGIRPIVEICPYFFEGETVDRIKTVIPHCRFIVTLRDPVDRLYSVYKNLRYTADARRGTLEQTLAVWPTMAKGNRYAPHLEGWFDAFGRENVLITIYDELRSNPQIYLNRVTDFIGIERILLSQSPQIADDVHSFKRAPRSPRLARGAQRARYWLKGHQAYRFYNLLERSGAWDFCGGRGELFQPLTPEQDERLRARYLPEVEALEELLKIDLSAWKKPRASRTIETSTERRVQRLANG
jgi:Sulfotransferase domain